jgi:hypothetical protein
MFLNLSQMPYKIPASGMWYSYTTQALMNALPKWMQMRYDKNTIGQKLMTPVGFELNHLNLEARRMHFNKYLTTADLIEPDLTYKIYLDRSADLDINSLTVMDIDGNVVEETDNLEDFFTKLPTRLEPAYAAVAPSGELSFNERVHDPTYSIVEHWVPDKSSPYYEVRPIQWELGDNRINKVDVYNNAEIYNNFGIDGIGSSYNIIDICWHREYLWALVDVSGSYQLCGMNRYTEIPEPTNLNADVLLALPSGHSNLNGIDVDSSGYFWVTDISGSYYQIKPVHDYFILDVDLWIIYTREPYSNGVIVT